MRSYGRLFCTIALVLFASSSGADETARKRPGGLPQPGRKASLTMDEPSARDTPNFVYIMSDEIAYFDPGFMGNPNIQTPNLDRMAQEGIIFKTMLAGGPNCAPTRCT
jgi:hypothetical protein